MYIVTFCKYRSRHTCVLVRSDKYLVADIISRCAAAGADMNHNYSNFKTSDETYESDSGDEYVDVYETIPRNLTALHVAARNNHTGAI